jgi:glycosyltransferase involved in cell wall biosynthesis
VLFIGTFGISYDLATVVEAARILENNEFPVTFMLCGDGVKKDSLVQLANNLSNVLFPGWLDEKMLASVLSIASTGLLSYEKFAAQSLPNKLFEYLSAGLPVISSLEGETKVLIAESRCGVSYNSRDPMQLANKIQELCRDQALRCELGRNALTLYKDRFCKSKIFDNYVSYVEGFLEP